MIDQLSRIGSRIAFLGSVVVVGLAILEKLVNAFGFTLTALSGIPPSRLVQYAAILLLFVVALQLREIKYLTSATRPD